MLFTGISYKGLALPKKEIIEEEISPAEEEIRLTSNSAVDGAPSWSPEGDKIVFQSNRADTDSNRDIHVMNTDGSGQTNLTNNSANDFSLSWSPDGKMIIFQSFRDGNWEIYIMNTIDTE